jgi:hypothetical protein
MKAAQENCAAFFSGQASDFPLRDEAEVISEHQQYEQGDRQADTNSKCLDRAVGSAFIPHQVKKCRTEAEDNENQECNDKVSHEVDRCSKCGAV